MFLTVALPESILILKFLGVICNVSKMFQKRQGKVLSCGALESALYPVNITAYCALLCTKPLHAHVCHIGRDACDASGSQRSGLQTTI